MLNKLYSMILEMMMSAQDRQVVAQVMQLVLARQDLVHYYHNGNIESKEMGFSVNFDTKKVTFGGVVYTIGKCATILLRSFATSQQLLQFHTSVADTIINTEVKKMPVVNDSHLPKKSFNLEDYIGKTIKVKLRNGDVKDTKVSRYDESRTLRIHLIGLSIYTESGGFWSDTKDDSDVIEILEVIS